MKANELMIGDWIGLDCAIPHFEDKEVRIEQGIMPCQVVKFDDYQVVVKRPDKQFQVVLYDAISPIPLTNEILEENVFDKKIHYGIFDDYYDFELWEYSDGIWNTTYHNCEVSLPDEQVFISFVHELQHFLTHCGIEKEIEL